MVTVQPERQRAELLLRLLLGDRRVAPAQHEWPALIMLARANRVLLRLHARLHEHPVRPPIAFARAVAVEEQRTHAALAVVARIGTNGERSGVRHVFLNVAQHAPDMGGALDVLVQRDARNADEALLDHLSVLPARHGLRARMTARLSYRVPEHDITVRVHHGRLGAAGEVTRFAELVLRRRICVRVGPTLCFTLSPEDQILAEAVQHGPLRRTLRLSDVYATIAVIRAKRLRWDALLDVADATGLLAPLTRFLRYVDQIHREAWGHPLLAAALDRRLLGGSWGRVTYARRSYRMPLSHVTGSVYLRQLLADVAAGDWTAAVRRCLLPLAALPRSARRLASPRIRG